MTESNMRNAGWLTLSALLSTLIAGCSTSPTIPAACTEIGCESTLQVNIENPSTEAFRLELYATPEGERRVIECASAGDCSNPVFLGGFTPTSAFVDVVTDESRITYEISPNYESRQPNGPDCPPICLYAIIRVTASGVVNV